MKRIDVLKAYFDNPPVTTREMMDLKKADPKGFDELVELAAKELGVTVE